MDDVGMDERDFQARGKPLPVNFTPKWMQDKEFFDMAEEAFEKSQSHSSGASFDMGGMMASDIDWANTHVLKTMNIPVESIDLDGSTSHLDEPIGRGTTRADWEAWKTQHGVDVPMLPCPESIPFAFNLVSKSRMAELLKVKPLAAKKLDPRAQIPTRAYNSNGYDLMCVEGGEVKYGEVTQFKTGLAFDLTGYLLKIVPKSGLAVKHGIHVMAGIVDQTYTGEVIVCLTKLTPGSHIFRDGDKIAQFILIRTEMPEIQEVVELPETQRGDKGFGSSGA